MRNRLLGTDIRRRVITGLFGAPLVLGTIIFGGLPGYAVLVGITCLICAWELRQMICPGSALGLVTLSALTLSCVASVLFNNFLVLLAVLVAVIIVCAAEAAYAIATRAPRLQVLMRTYAYQVVGGLYVGLPLSSLLIVRNMEKGALWTLMLFLNNWSTDSFALIGGRLAGRRKLAPVISPGKTVEGSLIGILCGFAIGMAFALFGSLPVRIALIANIVISVLTVIGDLLESWLKRTFSVKDAGTLLPGHGGLMDRVDGMLLAGPGLYIVLLLLRL